MSKHMKLNIWNV